MVALRDRAVLVGLTGATGCGKTELANSMVRRHGFTRLQIGQPIKDMLSALGLSAEELTGPPEVRFRPLPLLGGNSPRRAMETLGTDWGRDMMTPAIWANAAELKIRTIWVERPRAIIVDDLRFPTDWKAIERLGGIVVRIRRPGVGRRRTVADRVAHRYPKARQLLRALAMDPVHESEYHWHDAPASIDLVNDTTVQGLAERLVVALDARSWR